MGNISVTDTACASISIIDDAALEGDHSFTVSLNSVTPSGVTISVPSASTTVNIEDNKGTLQVD